MKKIFFIYLIIGGLLFTNSSKAQTQFTFHTTMGDFVVELYESIVPITAGNFDSLAQAKYYDGVIFHRVIDNFMIQGGDPTGTGSGGPGYTIPDEFDSSLSNIQKTISMANSGPNTGGSQFFINLKNNTYLDFDKAPLSSKHPVFGIVVSGFSIVQAIGSVPTDGGDKPLTDVVMDSIRLVSTSSINDNTSYPQSRDISVYPNPMTAESTISINVITAGKFNVSVYDQLGRLAFFSPRDLVGGINLLDANEIFNPKLSSGIYNLVLTNDRSTPIHYQVVIQ